jgi:putative effector of murein hydrolase LrgA (UPF0299 family)
MLSRILSGPIAIVYYGGGLWSLALIVSYLADAWGWFFALLSLFLLPIVLYIVPLYAGFADGYWLPAQVAYGTVAVAFVLSILAGAVSSSER